MNVPISVKLEILTFVCIFTNFIRKTFWEWVGVKGKTVQENLPGDLSIKIPHIAQENCWTARCRKLAVSAGNITLLESGLYAVPLHLLLLPVLFGIGIIRMALLGYIGRPAGIAGWSSFSLLWEQPVGHQRTPCCWPCIPSPMSGRRSSSAPILHVTIYLNLMGWGLVPLSGPC